MERRRIRPRAIVDVRTHDEAFVTVGQVAQFLHVTPKTLIKLIAAGLLPALKIGTQWRIERTALLKFMDEQRLHPK